MSRNMKRELSFPLDETLTRNEQRAAVAIGNHMHCLEIRNEGLTKQQNTTKHASRLAKKTIVYWSLI